MQRSARRSTSHTSRPWSGQRGAVAILLVFGLSAVLLFLVALMAEQATAALRLSAAEEVSFKVRTAITSALNEIAVKAEGDPNFWQGDPCTPPSATVSQLSCQVLPSRLVTMSLFNPDWSYETTEQYPVRITWRYAAHSSQQETYAWVVVDPEMAAVLGVWAERSWCEPDPDFLTGSVYGFCKLGG